MGAKITDTNYCFPFGESVNLVQQQDRSPKRVFVLGVYASAIHARWVGADGRTRVNALAVASEPYIFWRGDGVEDILKRINIPDELGKLLPAAANLNGPSGIALDELFLHPLQLQRSDAWLCDLVPHSCLNPKQKAALEREYYPLLEQYSLPKVTLPPVPRQLADETRRKEIIAELAESGAKTLILLGDEPIRWFLRWFEPRWQLLSEFGQDQAAYGRLHNVEIEGKSYQMLPLVHPRQAARLGSHSAEWQQLHERWINLTAPTLLV